MARQYLYLREKWKAQARSDTVSIQGINKNFQTNAKNVIVSENFLKEALYLDFW